MTDAEFDERVVRLRKLEYREDFQRALCDLYAACEAHHRVALRRDVRAKTLHEPQAWRYPTDYFRSHLIREEKALYSLLSWSIYGRTDDFRDDLYRLAHAYHTLILFGFGADGVLNDVADLSALEEGCLIREFVARKPKDKSMEAWNLHVVELKDGPAIDTRG